MKNGAPYFRPDSRGSQYPMVNTGKHHCVTPLCRGIVDKKKHHSNKCSRCHWKRFKASNPLRYAFGNLKRRAKQRGKTFLLTFEQYAQFARNTEYEKLKGTTTLSLSIDRTNNDGPYASWNILTMTLRENSRKQFVPFYAKQMPNEGYTPSAEELEEIRAQLEN